MYKYNVLIRDLQIQRVPDSDHEFILHWTGVYGKT